MTLARLSQSRLLGGRGHMRAVAGADRRLGPQTIAPFAAGAEAAVPPPHPRPIRAAFVGLGNMGLPMALNLSRGWRQPDGPRGKGGGGAAAAEDADDVRVTVYDADERNVSDFLRQAEMGGFADVVSPAGSLKCVAKESPDFVFASLPSCEASEAVVVSILKNLAPPRGGNGEGCVFVDASTVSPLVSRRLHALTKDASLTHDYVDAPVSGGVRGAMEGTLTFMVGCDSDETLRAAHPLLRRMGRGIMPCGGPGTGSATKLCNNLALASQMAGICEAMNLGDALGVDPAVLAGVMNVSTAKCWSCEVNNPHPAAAESIGSGASAVGYEGCFGTSLMVKDLNLALGAGKGENLDLPMTVMSRDLWTMAESQGLGKKDFGVLLQFLKRRGADDESLSV